MCQSLAQGGQRCAAHTRPRYQTAQFGTPDWDTAAAAYASTPTGRMELAASLAAAEAAEDIRSAVAFQHAMEEGQRLREKAELFRDELANRTVPPVDATDDADTEAGRLLEEEPVDDHDYGDDYDGGADFGYEYTDEEQFETSPYRDWSPSMSTQRWDTNDPAFQGCTQRMDTNQFIDQVCGNVGITRSEFEEAAAAYIASRGVPLALPEGGMDQRAGRPAFLNADFTMDAESLRFLIAQNAAPRYTPEQIREIAHLARDRRAKAESAQDQSATEEAAAPATGTGTGRSRRVELPDDPAELSRLADSDDPAVREAVAAHEATPADVLDRMASTDAKVDVRAAAARNENLPQDRLVSLATDRSIKVRAGAARNPSMPTEHLITLADDANDTVKGAVARNPSTPADTYQSLACHDSAVVRKHAARRRDIPRNIAHTLAADSDRQVRSSLAKNRTAVTDVVDRLCGDTEQSVRAAAARNPNISPALLRGHLSRDRAAGVRAAVARNENTTLAVLTRLSSDPDPWVRRNVVWNPQTPATLLYCLTQDSDDGVRSSARHRNDAA